MSACSKANHVEKQIPFKNILAATAVSEIQQDMQRVQSIIWAMSESLKHDIDKADRSNEGVMETGEPEAYMENTQWLFDILNSRVERLGEVLNRMEVE